MTDNMNINAKISLFENYFLTTPKCDMTIYQFYENVIYSDYISEIAAIRAETDKAKRDKLKAKLPCVSISGTFTQRANDYLIQHSGFIAIDIDSDHNTSITDWQSFRDTLGTWSEVLFASLSVSGRGVFCIIPLAYPHKHKEQYLALEADFLSMGVITDPKCKDIARLRVISSDPQATWNPDAKPYSKVIIEKPTQHTTCKTSPELNKLAAWTDEKVGIFTSGNRNQWVTTFAGAAHRFSISQGEVESYCKALAQSDFSEREIMASIKSIYSNQHYKSIAITNN